MRRPSPKFLLLLCLLGLLAFAAYAATVKIPAIARGQIEAVLKKAGFTHAVVDTITVQPSSLTASNIKLDEYGFDEIKLLTADINWMSYLTSGEISRLAIKGVTIGRDSTNISSSFRQLVTNLLDLPPYRIDISDAVIDLTTSYGEIRILGEAAINTAPGSDLREIKAIIKADQYQLGFDSLWQGTLGPDGTLDLSGTVEQGRINIGPMRISRFNGWGGLSSASGKYAAQGQLEAGSATFMDVPLQKLSLVGEYGADQSNVIFRSGVSGTPDILFTADYFRLREKQSFNAILRGKNLGNFLDYIEEATGRPKTINDALLSTDPFELTCNFQPERRFVGGPLPFTISLQQSGEKTVDGNFLFYPDTLDVRGALESTPEMTTALQDYFKIPAANINQNFIRLDGGARRFFMFEEKPDGAAVTNTQPLIRPDAPDETVPPTTVDQTPADAAPVTTAPEAPSVIPSWDAAPDTDAATPAPAETVPAQ